jgi:SHS2 domain-containing protein
MIQLLYLNRSARPFIRRKGLQEVPIRGHDTIEHTADMGLRGWGPLVEQAFEETALAMFELMIDGNGLQPCDEVHFEVKGQTLPELLIEFLNKLLLDADIAEMAFLSVHIDSIVEREGVFRLKGGAKGISRNDVRDRLLGEVKAATYYGVAVEKDANGGWETRCVVDL